MKFELRHLEAFVAVAEELHFGRAAGRLHVAQPALSQQIMQLEAASGAALFDRLAKSVRLTPFGREFIERARQIVEGADELEAFAAGKAGAPTHPIRFGLIPTVAPYLLPDVFPALREALPALSFTISENRTDALIAGLNDGGLDIALIATDPPAHGPKLRISPLFDDSFVLAATEAEQVSSPVDLAALPPDRIMLLSEGHCFRDQAIAACGLADDPASRTFAATSLSTIVEFVANGQGVTLLPEISLRKEATDPRIRISRLRSPGAARRLSLVWRDATPFGELFEKIAETIRGLRPIPRATAGT